MVSGGGMRPRLTAPTRRQHPTRSQRCQIAESAVARFGGWLWQPLAPPKPARTVSRHLPHRLLPNQMRKIAKKAVAHFWGPTKQPPAAQNPPRVASRHLPAVAHGAMVPESQDTPNASFDEATNCRTWPGKTVWSNSHVINTRSAAARCPKSGFWSPAFALCVPATVRQAASRATMHCSNCTRAKLKNSAY